MIPTIGLMVGVLGVMVGLYIITRMNELASRDDSSSFLPMLTAVVAIVGIAALAFLSFSLISASVSTPLSGSSQQQVLPDLRP